MFRFQHCRRASEWDGQLLVSASDIKSVASGVDISLAVQPCGN